MTPPVSAVLETSLYVENVARSVEFYQRVFGFEAMMGDHRFCAMSVSGQQVLLLFQVGSAITSTTTAGGTIPPHDGGGQLHLAFSIGAADMPQWERHLAGQGIAIESRVRWPRGGESVYFRDPDAHLVELVTPGCWPIY